MILVLLFTVDEMYLASLINKGREAHKKGATDPTALPAEVILNMATVNGAQSVLWDNEIGSLEVGKKVRGLSHNSNLILEFCCFCFEIMILSIQAGVNYIKLG